MGGQPIRKYVRAGGRYFWGFYCPGFPSAAFDRFVDDAFERLRPRHPQPRALQSVVLAVTSDCPLACEQAAFIRAPSVARPWAVCPTSRWP